MICDRAGQYQYYSSHMLYAEKPGVFIISLHVPSGCELKPEQRKLFTNAVVKLVYRQLLHPPPHMRNFFFL